MEITILSVIWIVLNIILLVPLAVVLTYAISEVHLVLASVANLDEPTYEPLDLGQIADRDDEGVSSRVRKDDPETVERGQIDGQDDHEPSPPYDEDNSRPRVDRFSFLSMVRLLCSPRKWLSISRGFGWYLPWIMVTGSMDFAAPKLPFVVGFPAQVAMPLVLIPLHTLWIHTILTPSSSRPFWRRIAPIGKTFKAVLLPMFIYSITQAITEHTISYVAGDSFSILDPSQINPQRQMMISLLRIIQVIILFPANLLLVRVEASLLPHAEPTILSLDPALSNDQFKRGYMNLIEAWESTKWALVADVACVYLKIIAITAVTAAVVGTLDGILYILLVHVPSEA